MSYKTEKGRALIKNEVGLSALVSQLEKLLLEVVYLPRYLNGNDPIECVFKAIK
jgi:hypothetical protein